jgi:hypothetical protein
MAPIIISTAYVAIASSTWPYSSCKAASAPTALPFALTAACANDAHPVIRQFDPRI